MRIAAAVSDRTGLFYGWWVVFASAAIVFLTGGTFFYGFGALFNPILAEFGWSRTAVSFAFSLRTEVGGLAAPLVGHLVDRIGARRLLTAGVFLVGLGFLLMSRMETLWAFYGSVMVIAFGMSAAGGPVAMAAIALWFRRKRGRALALMSMGAGASGVMVLVLEALIAGFGWRTALLIMALVQWAVAIPLALSVRNRPADLGLVADGEPTAADGTAGSGGAAPAALEGLTVGEAVRSGFFWRLSLAVALSNLGSTAIIVHQIPFFTSGVGVASGVAAASLTAMSLLSLIGRFCFGWLADFAQKRFVLAASYALSALGIFLFAAIYEPWQIFFVLPLFAIGFGGAIPVRPAFQAEYFGLRAFGAIQGLVFTIATVGGVAGPVIAGGIYDWTGGYRPAFLILASGTAMAVPLILSVGRPQSVTPPSPSSPPAPAAPG
ncbi:MAG: MFS transporter [Chloroflexi bacterium]|nr:MFS transporter [Chloroflexota bacterium]